MAFEDVVFPYYPMKHNISKTIIDPVSIVSNGNREYRIKRQSWERYKWTLPTQTMTNAQKEEIKSFLLQRGHSLNSFKFVDPDAAVWNNTRLLYHSGTTWEVNLPFSQTDQTVPGNHPLFNATIDGGLLDGVGTGPRTITILDGVPTVNYTTSNSGSVVEITDGVPYFTVRLASTVSYALAALDVDNETQGVQHAAIELIEVFGEY